MLALRADRAMSCAAVADARAGSFPVRGTPQVTPPMPRLLDRVREAIRARHDRRRTDKTDVAWIRRDILCHGTRHPAEMGAAEVTRFLTSLAVDGHVAASTQTPALSALLFLYREAEPGRPAARPMTVGRGRVVARQAATDRPGLANTEGRETR